MERGLGVFRWYRRSRLWVVPSAGVVAALTALVLTIVAVVIQLATQSLSPRAVRTFLQDAHSHLTIGTFVTTFTYVLVVLQQFRATHDGDSEEAVVASRKSEPLSW